MLFTKWDRFSRNVSRTYQAIDVLRKLKVEPQAIEQRKQLLLELEKLNTRLQNARIQKVDGILDDDDFQIVKKETNKKIVFDGRQHRTQRINEAIQLIYQKTNTLEQKKK